MSQLNLTLTNDNLVSHGIFDRTTKIVEYFAFDNQMLYIFHGIVTKFHDMV